jgi:hypothetical protein
VHPVIRQRMEDALRLEPSTYWQDEPVDPDAKD